MIIGHEKQWDFLKRQLQNLRVPHAFLFSGEGKLGKRKVAFEFLKLLNCQNSDFSEKPCQVCQSCRAIEKGVHPDFFLIKPEKTGIGISQIRQLAESLSLKPYFQWKTAVIDQACLMTAEAQNCLLKTLEEPSGKTCLILISEHPSLLFGTILSRVQEIKFFPVKKEKILDYLINQGIKKSEAQEIVELSSGRPGQAIEFLSNPEKLNEYKSRIKEFLLVFKGNLAQRFHYAKVLTAENENLKEVFDIWLNHLRQSMISKIKKKDFDDVLKMKKILEEIAEIQSLISQSNINKRLALETLFLRI